MTVLAFAVGAVKHPPPGVTTQVTLSLLAKLLEAKVVPPVPALFPFNFHWKVGLVPQFTGVAVKLVFTPLQIELFGVLMVIEGAIFGLIVTSNGIDKTEVVVTHAPTEVFNVTIMVV